MGPWKNGLESGACLQRSESSRLDAEAAKMTVAGAAGTEGREICREGER